MGLEAGSQLKSQGKMAWRWRDLSVGLYVPLLEFNQGSIAAFHIMYRDSERIWDGINWDGKRASFFALREIELLCRPKPAF